jgi:hypothetical protein
LKKYIEVGLMTKLYVAEVRSSDSSKWVSIGIWTDLSYLIDMCKPVSKGNGSLETTNKIIVIQNIDTLRYRVYDNKYDNEINDYLHLMFPLENNKERISQILGPYILVTLSLQSA